MLQHLPHTPGINKNWHQPNFSVAKLQPFSVKNLCLKKDLCFNTLEPIVWSQHLPQKNGYKCIKYNTQRFLHVFKRKKNTTQPRNPGLLRKEGHSRHGVRFGRRGSAATPSGWSPKLRGEVSEGRGKVTKNHDVFGTRIWHGFLGGDWLVEDF